MDQKAVSVLLMVECFGGSWKIRCWKIDAA
jgi:hypothetical protein